MANAAPAPKTTPPPAAPPAPTSRLALVKKERMALPPRIVIYGPEGVGKTTLAADAPDPIFFDLNDGSGEMAVARYPFTDGPRGHVPANFAAVLSGIDDLGRSPHDYKTLVIDTADDLENLIWRHMLDRDSAPSARNQKNSKYETIEDYGFGKGYQMAVDEWRLLCARLDRLRSARGMGIVILSHAQIRTFKNPTGDDYDRWQLRIHEKAAGFLRGWAEVTAFACFEDTTDKATKQSRAKGYSTGHRLLRTARSAAVDAKSRLALPDEVEIEIGRPWAPFAAAVEHGRETEAKTLIAQIDAEVDRIGDDVMAEKAKAAVTDAVAKNDTDRLRRIATELQKRPAKAAEQANNP